MVPTPPQAETMPPDPPPSPPHGAHDHHRTDTALAVEREAEERSVLDYLDASFSDRASRSDAIFALVQTEQSSLFPDRIALPATNGGEALDCELFGTLIQRMEAMLRNDSELFQEVVQLTKSREEAKRRAVHLMAMNANGDSVKAKTLRWRSKSHAHIKVTGDAHV